MGSRLYYSQGRSMRVTERVTDRVTRGNSNWRKLIVFSSVALWSLAMAPLAAAGGDAPSWMHALVGVTVPPYDDKTDAVLLYSERNVSVLSVDKTRVHVREAYKILACPKGGSRNGRCLFQSRSKDQESAWLVHSGTRQGL